MCNAVTNTLHLKIRLDNFWHNHLSARRTSGLYGRFSISVVTAREFMVILKIKTELHVNALKSTNLVILFQSISTGTNSHVFDSFTAALRTLQFANQQRESLYLAIIRVTFLLRGS